jgi:5-methylcytosine-specific restriction endonuclease McrA
MPRKYIRKAVRQQVIERSKGYCEYCKFLAIYSHDSFVIEHIEPIVLGSSNELDNLAYACGGCNSFKQAAVQAIDPETQQFVPLFHPREQLWKDHFKWSTDVLLIEGLTPSGRATIERLKTNRSA